MLALDAAQRVIGAGTGGVRRVGIDQVAILPGLPEGQPASRGLADGAASGEFAPALFPRVDGSGRITRGHGGAATAVS